MNKLIKGILIGIGIVLGIAAVRTSDLFVSKVTWEPTKQVEYRRRITINSDNLDGDSLTWSFPAQTAISKILIRNRGNGTAYTTATTDTIKFYGEYDGGVVTLAYISDSLFKVTEPCLSWTSITSGTVNGLRYSMGIPDSKFSGGDMKYEITLYIEEQY